MLGSLIAKAMQRVLKILSNWFALRVRRRQCAEEPRYGSLLSRPDCCDVGFFLVVHTAESWLADIHAQQARRVVLTSAYGT